MHVTTEAESEVMGLTSRGMSRIARTQKELGEGYGKDSPSEPLVETNLSDTLILGF